MVILFILICTWWLVCRYNNDKGIVLRWNQVIKYAAAFTSRRPAHVQYREVHKGGSTTRAIFSGSPGPCSSDVIQLTATTCWAWSGHWRGHLGPFFTSSSTLSGWLTSYRYLRTWDPSVASLLLDWFTLHQDKSRRSKKIEQSYLHLFPFLSPHITFCWHIGTTYKLPPFIIFFSKGKKEIRLISMESPMLLLSLKETKTW